MRCQPDQIISFVFIRSNVHAKRHHNLLDKARAISALLILRKRRVDANKAGQPVDKAVT